MKKRILAVTLMLAMTVSLMAGCGNKESDADGDKITLTFLDKHPEDEYKGYFEQAIADFEELHPDVDIEYENISDQAIKEKLSVLAAGGTLPDIFFAWGGECLNRFSRAGKILDLTPYMDEDTEWRDSFLPSFLSSSVYEGKNYAVPYRSSVLYMLYNKQVFAENNLEVPTTWDEFINVCETLKDSDVNPIAFGNSDKWYTMWYVGQFNANYVNAETRVKDYTPSSGEFVDEGYTKAIQTFLNLNEEGYLGENVNSKDYYQVREEFAAGMHGMILDATSQFSFYTGAMGEDGYGYFKIPIPNDAQGDEAATIVTGGSENYAISAECEHPDEAVEFLKFMTSKEQALKQTKETGLPNALIGGITEENSDSVIVAAYETAEDYTAIAEWLDQCIDGKLVNTYMADLQEGLDGKSAEDIMADVQKAAKEVSEVNQ
ncbi:ABC transporter substrate-binding protein [Mediterraneibacter massiliensis]|jgi:raffinose/stachyose/melibiose transport system substrate-binding protein|uniref:ABC transporter substrate-binding protein n=1 Tax=Mediterraneibacter massiliensis TaxID=1720300 RepID=UPI000E4B3EF6|nr:sugar ABC transporter substrate-binding protein [Mediterraneibacter massiliensis]RGT71012.1 sugar ABC transporter substrate-binding protein [Ruminococcus sp. AF18-22]